MAFCSAVKNSQKDTSDNICVQSSPQAQQLDVPTYSVCFMDLWKLIYICDRAQFDIIIPIFLPELHTLALIQVLSVTHDVPQLHFQDASGDKNAHGQV